MSITTEELSKLLAEASPGPFRAQRNEHYWMIQCDHHISIGDTCQSNFIYPDGGDMLPADDAEKIAASNAKLFALSRDLAKRVIAAENLVEALRIIAASGDGYTSGDGQARCVETARTAISEWEAGR